MGSCLSSFSAAAGACDAEPPSAKVIEIDGSLKKYYEVVRAPQVLGRNHSTCFLCNADSLFCGYSIQALGSDQHIKMGQLYFSLPAIILRRPLTAPDMAALALRASSALAACDVLEVSTTTPCLGSRRRKVFQVVPMEKEALCDDEYERVNEACVGGWRSSCRAEANIASNGTKRWPSRPELTIIEEECE